MAARELQHETIIAVQSKHMIEEQITSDISLPSSLDITHHGRSLLGSLIITNENSSFLYISKSLSSIFWL